MTIETENPDPFVVNYDSHLQCEYYIISIKADFVGNVQKEDR